MNAVEELRLQKAQGQDVARVCNAVARGDLSQKITVPVQGVVMVQLQDLIITMVDLVSHFLQKKNAQLALMRPRLTNLDNSRRRSLVSVRKLERKGGSWCFFLRIEPFAYVPLL